MKAGLELYVWSQRNPVHACVRALLCCPEGYEAMVITKATAGHAKRR